MANWHCILLLFVTLVSGSFHVMRTDDGDFFSWHGNNKITCEDFTSHTASIGGIGSGCRCKYPLTFSTANSSCVAFEGQGMKL